MRSFALHFVSNFPLPFSNTLDVASHRDISNNEASNSTAEKTHFINLRGKFFWMN